MTFRLNDSSENRLNLAAQFGLVQFSNAFAVRPIIFSLAGSSVYRLYTEEPVESSPLRQSIKSELKANYN